jgi:hypothetical protein
MPQQVDNISFRRRWQMKVCACWRGRRAPVASGPRLADRCSLFVRLTRPRGLRFKRGPTLIAACGAHGPGSARVAGAPSPSHYTFYHQCLICRFGKVRRVSAGQCSGSFLRSATRLDTSVPVLLTCTLAVSLWLCHNAALEGNLCHRQSPAG